MSLHMCLCCGLFAPTQSLTPPSLLSPHTHRHPSPRVHVQKGSLVYFKTSRYTRGRFECTHGVFSACHTAPHAHTTTTTTYTQDTTTTTTTTQGDRERRQKTRQDKRRPDKTIWQEKMKEKIERREERRQEERRCKRKEETR